eukprot:CAMPEP_0206379738 /NCGR_PEP_ID=MMETSP0294-20121207/11568_1 /ASSEMBLY_ACC=CAM_ASM_000327 /TAXON_ID=39354 /ORGANISM="Heterosigma akashiwo, Strain CCMP2393" /LENGTH=66 /DNA_ID=CAMNT_0053828735 /DNA_START=175 /DNA_END=375 /DNA_ORIENTATION=+
MGWPSSSQGSAELLCWQSQQGYGGELDKSGRVEPGPRWRRLPERYSDSTERSQEKIARKGWLSVVD